MTRTRDEQRAWRQQTKRTLVAEHGGKCVDCDEEYPAFVMHFDHRDPAEKCFSIGDCSVVNIERLRSEAAKCDLVCPNCHAIRTHKQRCPDLDCEYCIASGPAGRGSQVVTLEVTGSSPVLAAESVK